MAFTWILFRNSVRLNGISSKFNKKILWNIKYVHTNRVLRNTSSANKRLEEQSTKFRSFVLARYVNYVKDYDKVLESKFPAAMRVYRIFMVGTKDFLSDMKQFLKIMRIVNTNEKGLKALSRQEIELYHKMPKDMIRVAPVLILSAVPLSNYVIFPLAYFFPRVLLSSHFWSIQQKSDFAILNLTKKLVHYKPVFRCIQEKLPEIQPLEVHLKWSEVIALLGSGQQPKTEQIIACKHLFDENNIYNLDNLKSYHVKELSRMHGLHAGLFRRKRLSDHGMIINEMDLAIDREGGANAMSMDALKNACFIRGLNATNMKQTSMINWLNQWITVSKLIDRNHVSLLLHCPILLAYNEPTNWMLIYNNRYNHIV